MDMIGSGLKWLSNEISAYASVEVIYQRGQSVKVLRAVPSKTHYERTDDYGYTVDAFSTDFVFPADELATIPQRGDLIKFRGLTYELLDLAGEGCFRWCDPQRTSIRVHAKARGAK